MHGEHRGLRRDGSESDTCCIGTALDLSRAVSNWRAGHCGLRGGGGRGIAGRARLAFGSDDGEIRRGDGDRTGIGLGGGKTGPYPEPIKSYTPPLPLRYGSHAAHARFIGGPRGPLFGSFWPHIRVSVIPVIFCYFLSFSLPFPVISCHFGCHFAILH